MIDKGFLRFGEIGVVRTIRALFYIGVLPALWNGYLFGRHIYLTYTFERTVQVAPNAWTSVMENSRPLGFVAGLLGFVVTLLLWRITCELLIILFRCCETYVERNRAL